MDMKEYADGIVHTVRDPLLVLDGDLRVKTASPSFYQFFKVTKEHTLGHLIYELGGHQWDIPALRQLLQEILRDSGGELNNFSVEHDFPNIGRRILVLNARRLRTDGVTGFILLSMEDITERRRAELEVARQRTWFQTTLSSIGDAVIATDGDTQITFMNPTAERLTGWKGEEASGRPLSEIFNIINEETRNQVESPVTKAIRRGAIVGLANHTLLIARDGTERPIDDSAAPIRDEAGTISGVALVFHDISERRRAELKIEASESRYRRLFETAQDGILILDAKDGRVIEVNRFLMDLLRHSREHFVGKELWELGMFQDIEASKAAMQQLQEKGYVRHEDLPLMDRDGRQIHVEFISNRYHEDHRMVFQCNIRDISQRKQIEREREGLMIQEHAARVEAQSSERANRAKDVFLATLSHEMRTPLNAILGWAQILGKGDYSSEDLKEGVEVIQRNASIQAKLIEDVLDISRIVSGKMRLDLLPCDFKKIIAAAVETVRAAADAKGIHIDIEIDPVTAETVVFCDASRIQQVLWNLLSNSIKFGPQGAKVTIALGSEKSRLRIVVSDNGPGIDPHFLPYIFDRFRQADSSTKRKFGGLGLGLSIVKHLVELHGGTVQVRSEGEGKGATFIVNLPIRAVDTPDAEEGSQQKPTPPEHPGVRLDGLRLLVVDDEPDARRLVARVLEETGATVTTVATVREARRLLEEKESTPNVLISDLSMPEEDGFDLIRHVRSTGHTVQQLPAVALTAFADKGYARSALLEGFQVHVPKPVDPNDLIAVVASLAGRTGNPSSTASR